MWISKGGDNLKDRIRQVRKDAGLTQEKFGDAIGVSKMAVTYYENGNRTPQASTVKLISARFNVNEEWLLTGRGEPYGPVTKNQILAEFINRVMPDKDEAFRKRYLVALSNVPDEGWAILEKFFDDLYNDSE